MKFLLCLFASVDLIQGQSESFRETPFFEGPLGSLDYSVKSSSPESLPNALLLGGKKSIPALLKGDLWEQLSPQAKELSIRAFKLSEGKERQGFVSLLNAFGGGKIDLDQDSTWLTRRHTARKLGVDLDSFRSYAKARTVIALLWEMREGVILTHEKIPEKVWLCRFTKEDLRAFTIDEKGRWDDKTYLALRTGIIEEVDEEFANHAIELLMLGGRKENFPMNSPRQRELLLDIASIFIAEAYHCVNKPLERDQILPGMFLVALIINDLESGPIVSLAQQEPWSPEELVPFGRKSYDELFPLYEEAATKLMGERKPALLSKLRSYFPNTAGTLQFIVDGVQRPEPRMDIAEFLKLSGEVVHFLEENGTEITKAAGRLVEARVDEVENDDEER